MLNAHHQHFPGLGCDKYAEFRQYGFADSLSRIVVPFSSGLHEFEMLTALLSYLNVNKWQMLRFGIVGLTTFALNFFFLWLFYGVGGLDYRIAVTCSYTLAVFAHFMLNRSFTYGLGGVPETHNVLRYLAMLLINYLITLGITTATVELLGLTPYFGIVFSEFGTASTGFLLMKHFVFVPKEKGT